MCSGMKSCLVRIPTTGGLCEIERASAPCYRAPDLMAVVERERERGGGAYPGVLGTTQRWRRPSSRKRTAALVLVMGWRSTYISILLLDLQVLELDPFPDPALAKSNAPKFLDTWETPVATLSLGGSSTTGNPWCPVSRRPCMMLPTFSTPEK
ncbi:unnamed protein product [Spirodela intermedia]|uniref:Uncharacterized protein n=1 Tax=Spirodela intermedia TaxID=51605 RepID=A0A7I8J1B3_SPIIN|nr:unnamed protein product [Spirodela intermedia]CAA6663927.1 unnamed protein product [Spirodela intermedia]